MAVDYKRRTVRRMLESPADVHAADQAEQAAKDRERRVALAEAQELANQKALKRRMDFEAKRRAREDEAAIAAGWSEAATALAAEEAASRADAEEVEKNESAKEELAMLKASGEQTDMWTLAAWVEGGLGGSTTANYG